MKKVILCLSLFSVLALASANAQPMGPTPQGPMMSPNPQPHMRGHMPPPVPPMHHRMGHNFVNVRYSNCNCGYNCHHFGNSHIGFGFNISL